VASVWAWQQPPIFAEHNLVVSFANLQKGRVLTLVAALFVHANVLHLIGNMLFLFVFGNTLEKTVGPGKLLMVFFTGGILSFILSLPFMPHGTGMLGALGRNFHASGMRDACEPTQVLLAFPRAPGIGGRYLFRLQRRRGRRKEPDTWLRSPRRLRRSHHWLCHWDPFRDCL
jgi:membrane associated rhomboid family serine protease